MRKAIGAATLATRRGGRPVRQVQGAEATHHVYRGVWRASTSRRAGHNGRPSPRWGGARRARHQAEDLPSDTADADELCKNCTPPQQTRIIQGAHVPSVFHLVARLPRDSTITAAINILVYMELRAAPQFFESAAMMIDDDRCARAAGTPRPDSLVGDQYPGRATLSLRFTHTHTLPSRTARRRQHSFP